MLAWFGRVKKMAAYEAYEDAVVGLDRNLAAVVLLDDIVHVGDSLGAPTSRQSDALHAVSEE